MIRFNIYIIVKQRTNDERCPHFLKTFISDVI